MIRDLVHPDADLVFDVSRPDGMPRRLLDVSALNDLGWRPTIKLADGLASTYAWYQGARDAESARGVVVGGAGPAGAASELSDAH